MVTWAAEGGLVPGPWRCQTSSRAESFGLLSFMRLARRAWSTDRGAVRMRRTRSGSRNEKGPGSSGPGGGGSSMWRRPTPRVTLAQVFWIKDSAGQPERFYMVADRALTLAGDFADFGSDIADLKKRLRKQTGVEVFDAFPAYGAAFRRRFC